MSEPVDIEKICKVLEGRIRGKPVAISRFVDHPPSGFEGLKVDPCQILRHAMDDGRRVYFDREHQDCVHGAYITGVHPGNEQIRSGRLLTDYIPVYNLEAAHTFNSGEYILPQDTVKGFCAAPLDDLPKDMVTEWIVLVCSPAIATLAGAARAVKDGTRPDTAAGNSFCSDLFVTPFYNDNVVVTTGDMGGRINNRMKDSEMFVIIPARWADNLIQLIGEVPDVKGIYEATRPDDSVYWGKQNAKAQRASGSSDARLANQKYGLEISMPWDDDALDAIMTAPKFVRKMAIGNVEDFAEEQAIERVSLDTVKAQAEQIGMGRFMNDLSTKPGGLLRRMFGKR
ncbi:MAG: hypothetical protein ACJAYC_003648 [Halieaceae bacterium]|jgi:uncharacterized protein (DUF169 family)